ncbi:hypothetical protein BH11GEM1_BH11GEM1_25090 [soil metagenome]
MKRVLVRMLVASCGLVAIAYAAMFVTATPPTWAAVSLAIGANGVIMSLMALGAVRRDTMPRSLVWTFIGLFVLCAGCFVVALLLPAQEGAGGPLFLGLPIRTAIVLYGVGVVPIAILPFAYALTFESSTLSEDDLVRVRAARASRRSGESS